MTNKVAITAKNHNLNECLELAHKYGVGLEIQSFAFPPLLLDDDWSQAIKRYRQTLADFPYLLSIHGPFMDMAPGSPDPRFRQITYDRSISALRLAEAIGADTVVFHANFIVTIRNKAYRDGWTERMIDFFGPLTTYAEKLGLQVVVENMWEFDPSIIRLVLEGIASSTLNACLDVGHTFLFSELTLEEWLGDLSHWITYLHMNNHDGYLDIHHGLDDGIINYKEVLPMLIALPQHPRMVLEMEKISDMERSLKLLHLSAKST